MKNIVFLPLIFGMFSCLTSHAEETNLPVPYNFIEDLPFDEHGWFLNQAPLEAIIQKHKPKTVIEIGSWLGSSTRFIAKLLPEKGMVYAIDTWKGTAIEEATLKDPRIPILYQLFLSNVKHANLTHKITPIRMESLEAARSITIKADLIYIDASHDTASVYNDIIAWVPHLKEGGVMTGDDWNAPSVQAGVNLAAKKLGKKVNGLGNFWWYE